MYMHADTHVYSTAYTVQLAVATADVTYLAGMDAVANAARKRETLKPERGKSPTFF